MATSQPVADPSIKLEGAARNAPEIAGWTRAIEDAAYRSMQRGAFPVFLGGDHSLSMGSVSGVARHAAEAKRPLFVLWLDAHSDYNTPATSPSGNMHGMPVAFFCGEAGFDGILPAGPAAGAGRRTCSSSASARSIRPSATRSACAASTSSTCAPSTSAARRPSCAISSARSSRGRRPAACQPRRRFPRSRCGARRRHDGARRRHLSRGASGHGNAVRQRARRLARPGRAQSVPRRPRQERPRHGRAAASLFGRRIFDRPTQSALSAGPH